MQVEGFISANFVRALSLNLEPLVSFDLMYSFPFDGERLIPFYRLVLFSGNIVRLRSLNSIRVIIFDDDVEVFLRL